MPRPSLGMIARRWWSVGLVSLVGVMPAGVMADDFLLDDDSVPAQFQVAPKSVPAQKAHELEDPCTYQGLSISHAGTSSAAMRKSALAELPLDSLPEGVRRKAQSVIKGVSLYRRLPTISFEVDRSVYTYFLQHPDVAVASWRAMGISKFTLEETDPGSYHADAGDGSRGAVQVIYCTPEDTLLYCEGAFKSPLLPKPIVAKSLIRLQAKFEKDAAGRTIATHYGDVFVELPSQTVETVAKLISPISYSIADRNFKQLSFYAHMMTVAMARQPGWIEAMTQRMDGISAAQKDEFLRLSAASYLAARQRDAAKEGQPVTLEEVLKPLRVSPMPDVPVRPVGSGSSVPRVAFPATPPSPR